MTERAPQLRDESGRFWSDAANEEGAARNPIIRAWQAAGEDQRTEALLTLWPEILLPLHPVELSDRELRLVLGNSLHILAVSRVSSWMDVAAVDGLRHKASAARAEINRRTREAIDKRQAEIGKPVGRIVRQECSIGSDPDATGGNNFEG